MEQLIKQVIIQDVLQSLEVHNDNLNLAKDGLKKMEDKVAHYLEAASLLGDSEDDDNLRKYILRRVDRWKNILSEDKQKIKEEEDAIQMLELIRQIVQRRKDDLSV